MYVTQHELYIRYRFLLNLILEQQYMTSLFSFVCIILQSPLIKLICQPLSLSKILEYLTLTDSYYIFAQNLICLYQSYAFHMFCGVLFVLTVRVTIILAELRSHFQWPYCLIDNSLFLNNGKFEELAHWPEKRCSTMWPEVEVLHQNTFSRIVIGIIFVWFMYSFVPQAFTAQYP